MRIANLNIKHCFSAIASTTTSCIMSTTIKIQANAHSMTHCKPINTPTSAKINGFLSNRVSKSAY